MIKTGDKLEFAVEIIGTSGEILFNVGDKVTVSKVHKTESYISRTTWLRVPEKVYGVSIDDTYGIWLLNCFKGYETFKY